MQHFIYACKRRYLYEASARGGCVLANGHESKAHREDSIG